MNLPQAARKFIPQQNPFVLVDDLISSSEESTTCSFIIPEKHPLVCEGKLTEGGLCENIAQTAAAGNGFQSIQQNLAIPKGFIAGIKSFKLMRLPSINSNLKTVVTQENRVLDFNLVKGEIFQNDEVIASCEMKIYCPQ